MLRSARHGRRIAAPRRDRPARLRQARSRRCIGGRRGARNLRNLRNLRNRAAGAGVGCKRAFAFEHEGVSHTGRIVARAPGSRRAGALRGVAARPGACPRKAGTASGAPEGPGAGTATRTAGRPQTGAAGARLRH